MPTRISFTLIVSTILVLAPPAAFAQNNWIGPYQGYWNTPGNWSLIHVPTLGEDVAIGSGSWVFLNTNSNINSLTLDGGLYAWAYPGSGVLYPPTLNVTNALNIGPTGGLDALNQLDGAGLIEVGGDVTNTGGINLRTYNLSIAGNLSSSGHVGFGFQSALQVAGNLLNSGTIVDNGSLPLTVAGNTLTIGGTVTNLKGAGFLIGPFESFTDNRVKGDVNNYGEIAVWEFSTLSVDGVVTNHSTGQLDVVGSELHASGGLTNYGWINTIVATIFTPELDNGGMIVRGDFTEPLTSSSLTPFNSMYSIQVGTGTTSLPGYYQFANGTLGEFIDMSSFGVITVDDGLPVTLDGTLKVMLQPGYNPAIGSTYEFIKFSPGELDGVFANLQNALFNNGTEKWIVIYDNANGYVALRATATPEPASLLLICSGLLTVGYGVRRRR